MNTIKLQGIYTPVKAVKAGELKPGMVTVWNFGCKEIIKSICYSKSGKSLKLVIIAASGKEYNRTLRANRLVGIE